MYRPHPFAIDDPSEILRFITANAFGQLLSIDSGRIVSSYLPWHYDSQARTLRGHLAHNNPQLESIAGSEVLVTLEGPHGYISPRWYTKGGVPTWNYQAVHLTGRATTFTEPTRLAELVATLSAHYEAQFPEPWQPSYPPSMLKAIVGVEIDVTDIQAKYKLSQNRTRDEVEQVCAQLEAKGEHALAAAMRRALEQHSEAD